MTCTEGIIWDTYKIKLLSVRSSQARNWGSFKKPDIKLLLGMNKAQAQDNSKNTRMGTIGSTAASTNEQTKKQHTFCSVVPDKCQAQEVLDE